MRLTCFLSRAILIPAGTSSTGRGNPFLPGEKSPQPIAAFFMSAIQRGLVPFAFCYGGLFEASFALGRSR